MPRSRRKPGPLGPFVEGYRAWLLGRGYSPSVVVRSLITLGHLGRWLERNELARVAYLSTEVFMNDLISSLRRDRMGEFKERFRRVDVLMNDGLRVTGAIAHIDEDHGAVIAAAVSPAHQQDGLSGVPGAELAAHVSAAKVA